MDVGELVLFAPQHEPGTDTWLKLVVGNLMLQRLFASRPSSQRVKIISALLHC